MTTLTVRTTAELQDALRKATGGEVIALASGNYGDLSINGIEATVPITITSSDPMQPASFNSISLMDCTNIALAGLEVAFKPDNETVSWSSAIRIASSSGVDVTDCIITGGTSVRGIAPGDPAGTQGAEGIFGLPIGTGVTVLWSDEISLSNNEISMFQRGIALSDIDDISISGNEVFNIRTTQLAGGNCDNVLVEGNNFHTSNPWKYGGAGDHADNIHFWTVPSQSAPSENYVIRNNILSQGEGTPIMGIYFDDNKNDIGYTNVLIENNIVHQGHIQGIRIEDVDGLRIIDNTLVQSSGDPSQAPQIVLREGSNNVLIDGNILSGVDASRADIVRMGDNITVQIHDPLKPFYAGDLFTDALGGGAEGLVTLVGSVVEGYGATVLSKAPHILSARGEGLMLGDHTFSLGDADLSSGARVTWDLGDGGEAEGGTVSHRYIVSGEHVVTAFIEEGGTIRTVTKTIVALDPAPVLLSFDASMGLSAMLHASSVLADTYGAATLVSSDHGGAVRLKEAGAAIAIENTPEITTNPEFSLTVGFRKDAGHESEGGRILYFSGTAVIDIGADSVTLRGRTDIGEAITLTASGVGVKDADWHQITYSFSQKDGTAILYLDGEEVAHADGLKGAQHVTGSHDLHLGNPYGENIDGLLDDLAFVRASLSPEEVREAYDRFEAGESLDFGFSSDTPVAVADSEIVVAAEPMPEPVALPEPVPIGAGPADLAHAGVVFDLDASDLSGAKVTKAAGLVADGDGVSVRLAGDGGFVDLGDLGRPEDDGSITVDLSFDRDGTMTGAERLLWNHGTFGVELSDGHVTVLAGTADGRLARFKAEAEAIDSNDPHHLRISVDSDLDRIQIVVDGNVVLDDDSHDLALSRVTEASDSHDWTVGTAWNRWFDGDITGLVIADDAVFVDMPAGIGEWSDSQMFG